MMDENIEKFISFMKDIKNVSDNTAISYKRDLTKMKDYFMTLGIDRENKINETNLNSYILWLEKNGCASSTVSRAISSMKAYFYFLLQNGDVVHDPAMLVKNPVIEKKAPKTLTMNQLEKLLNAPACSNSKEIRDKAMLELMCSTGIRVSEIINLTLDNTNLNLSYIIVTNGKSKERIIPFSESCKIAIENYLMSSRGELLKEKGKECDALFISNRRTRMTVRSIEIIIQKYATVVDNKHITPHSLRRTFGTNTYQDSKDIYKVTKLLGHKSTSPTRRYVKVFDDDLSELVMNSASRYE